MGVKNGRLKSKITYCDIDRYQLFSKPKITFTLTKKNASHYMAERLTRCFHNGIILIVICFQNCPAKIMYFNLSTKFL
jgi:hypothetical protein